MKRLSFLFIVIVALLITSCGGQKGQEATDESTGTVDDVEFTDVSKDDSRKIADEYVLNISEYVNHNGRELDFKSDDKTICDSCYKFIYEFMADSTKEDFRRDLVTVTVNVQGGAVVSHSSVKEGRDPIPLAERCKEVLTCDDGRTFPVEEFDKDDDACYRVVYLGSSPCVSDKAEKLVAKSEDIIKCLEQGYSLDRNYTSDGYICVFPDKSFCPLETMQESCFMGDCFKKCVSGDAGEGLYDTCTNALVERMKCPSE